MTNQNSFQKIHIKYLLEGNKYLRDSILEILYPQERKSKRIIVGTLLYHHICLHRKYTYLAACIARALCH